MVFSLLSSWFGFSTPSAPAPAPAAFASSAPAPRPATLPAAEAANDTKIAIVWSAHQSEAVSCSSSSSSSSSSTLSLRDLAKAKHIRHIRHIEQERQAKASALASLLDQARNVPLDADEQFYTLVEGHPEILQSKQGPSILLQRVYGDIERLPEKWRAAVNARGADVTNTVDLSLYECYLSRNQIYKLLKAMKNIHAIRLVDCIFERETNVVFSPTAPIKMDQPPQRFFPQLEQLEITGETVPLNFMDTQLQGLEIAYKLQALIASNNAPSEFQKLLPRASQEEISRLCATVSGDIFQSWLARKVKPYSCDNDKNIVINGYLTAKSSSREVSAVPAAGSRAS